MTNFLADYALLTAGDEAPENYHLWCGISAISSIVGRKVWVNWGRILVKPHLYIVLLGPPGNGKNTALGVVKKLIVELGDIPYSAEAQTKESLCKELKGYERSVMWGDTEVKYTPMSIFVTELSHFLGPASGHMIDFLTTIYDLDHYDAKTKNRGNDEINGPCLNLLACTTPQWITTYLRSDIISGGFTRRALFINEDESNKRIPFPELTPEQHLARQRLLLQGARLKEAVGEFGWDQEAKEWFANWYRNYQLPVDLSTRWYHRTKHIQVLKTAMLVALAESNTLILKREHLQVAMELLDRIEPNLARVFQGMGRNELNAIAQKTVDLISLAGGWLPEKKLKSALFQEASVMEIEQVLEHLIRSDRIKYWDQKERGTGKLVRRLVALTGITIGNDDTGASAGRPSSTPPVSVGTGSPP